MGQSDPFVVLVSWTDSHRNPNIWVDVDSLDHTEAICTAVGIVAKWDKVGITLATCSQGEHFGSVFFIPKGAIRSVKVISTRKGRVLAPKDGRAAGAAD